MKTGMIALLLTLGMTSAHAAPVDPNLAKVKALASKYIRGSDVKIDVAASNDPFCGYDGKSYIATVSIRTYQRVLDEKTQSPTLKSVWTETRSYGITSEDLASGSRSLMANDQCLE